MKTYYRIVEWVRPKVIKTLFHGIKGSRVLPLNRWLTAEKKIVDDGGTKYLSGFHVMPTRESCKRYLYGSFDLTKRKLIVIAVYAKGLRRKKHSRSLIYLASKMYIPY